MITDGSRQLSASMFIALPKKKQMQRCPGATNAGTTHTSGHRLGFVGYQISLFFPHFCSSLCDGGQTRAGS